MMTYSQEFLTDPHAGTVGVGGQSLPQTVRGELKYKTLNTVPKIQIENLLI